MVEVVVEGVTKQRKNTPYIHRAWRWARVKQIGNITLVDVVDEEEEFNIRIYRSRDYPS